MYPGWEIFGFQITTFGVMVAIAILVGGQVGAASFDRAGLSRDDAWSLTVWCAVVGALSSHLWYAFEQLARGDPFLDHLLSRGGLTWYGGLVGGAATGLVLTHLKRLPWPVVFDSAAPALALAQAIGRVGCFLVGDDYGRVTDLPWGVAFPRGLPPTQEPVHPTMLYEIAWLLPLALWLWRRRGRSPFLLGEYLFLAGLGRLWIELLRVNPPLLGPLSNAQLVALTCMALGAGVWLYLRRGSVADRGAASRARPD